MAAAGPDLVADMDGPSGVIAPGATVSLSLAVENDPTHGNQNATGVVASWTLPATAVVSDLSRGNCSGTSGTIVCALADLPLGASDAMEMEIELGGQEEGRLPVSVSVTASQADRVPVDNLASHLLHVESEIFGDGFESGDLSAWGP